MKTKLMHIFIHHRMYNGLVQCFCVSVCCLSVHPSALYRKDKNSISKTRITKPDTHVFHDDRKLSAVSQDHSFMGNYEGKPELMRLGLSNLIFMFPMVLMSITVYILTSNILVTPSLDIILHFF